MKVQTTYLAAAINQTRKSLSWNESLGIAAYAASNHIILYDPQKSYVVGISDEAHGSHINCVQWITDLLLDAYPDRHFLLSTASDGSTKLWTYQPINNKDATNTLLNIKKSLKIFSTLHGHSGNVSCGSAVPFSTHNNKVIDKILVVTTADDFFLRGWLVDLTSGKEEDFFTQKLPGRSLALDLLIVPANSFTSVHWPIIVYGGDDGNLHMMSSSDGCGFSSSCTLSGHQDWVTSLAYCSNGPDILLSSGSKDGLIRLWRLSLEAPKQRLENELVESKSIVMKLHSNQENDVSLNCSLESILHGHDGLISSLDWQDEHLLSCSLTEDRSVLIWEQESNDAPECGGQIWVEKGRLGEIGGNREGFFNAHFALGGDSVMATSYQGGLHMWLHDQGSWLPVAVVSGHFNQVVNLDWEKNGRYLLTVSKDQTTRLHSQWSPNTNQAAKWQEIARPQVHGYDLASVACLDGFAFASAGEEKVVRGFTATRAFVRRARGISACQPLADSDSLELPEAASVPSLGLSNKVEDPTSDQSNSIDKEGPPTEDELMMGTLWPEVSKLYGHGNDLLALASSQDGSLIASTCRASVSIDANIIIWKTRDWVEIQSLSYHRLSVTQMEFSTCDRFLVSVSRDRAWAIFERGDDDAFALKYHSGCLDKKNQHSRIIWSCGWMPGSLAFITGSRDKSVAVWCPVRDLDKAVVSWERKNVFEETEEVMAVAVKDICIKQGKKDMRYLIAIGYVTGRLSLRVFDQAMGEELESADVEISHRKSIRRLKFRPGYRSNDCLTLASCGDDHLVLLHEIDVTSVY